MNSPYEDLEYLADFLPDEGEAVVVHRRGGELVCEPCDTFRHELSGRDGVTDPDFYGMLVQANARLGNSDDLRCYLWLLGTFWACVAFHVFSGIGWTGWYVDVGLILTSLPLSAVWMDNARQKYFQTHVQPMLETQIRRRELKKFAVIGSIRQHSEFHALSNELHHWVD